MSDRSTLITSLSPKKKALILQLLKNRGSEFNTYPLSFAQERLWFLDQLAPNSPFYNLPIALRLHGALSLFGLFQTTKEIIRRHGVLRTSILTLDGLPVQFVSSASLLSERLADLSGLKPDDSEAEARRQAVKEAERPFDLATGPLLRLSCIRLG